MIRVSHLVPLAVLAAAPAFAQTHSEFQRWEIDSTRSSVGFDASSTLHDFSGVCREVGGGAHADLNSTAQTAGGIIWCRAGALDTDNQDRDENMFENLGVAEFPQIRFSISALQGELLQGHGTLQLAGTYTIHGIDKQRSFPIEVRLMPDGSMHITGRSKFLLSEHQVVPESVMGIIGVDDEVEAWLDLFLVPQNAELVQTTHLPLTITETISMPGSTAVTKHLISNLYQYQETSFFDLEGVRSLSTPSRVQRIQLQDLTLSETWPSNDQAFQESRDRMQRLQDKYERLAESKRVKAGAKIQKTIRRMQETLAHAPPAKMTATILKHGDRTTISLGQRDWVVLENLKGSAKIPGLFATLNDLPQEVQSKLKGLSGTPSRVLIHSATAAGTRELVFDFGEALMKEIPAWNFTPSTWKQDANPMH